MGMFDAGTADPYATGLMPSAVSPNLYDPGRSSAQLGDQATYQNNLQAAQDQAQKNAGGPQAAQVTLGQIGGGDVTKALWAQQSGAAPSPADLQLQQGTEAAIAAQRSAAASSRLGTAGDAMKTAATGMANAQQSGSMNAAQLRAGETMSATQQLAGMAGQQAGLTEQTNLANQGANLQQQQISNQNIQATSGQNLQYDVAQAQMNNDYNQMMAGQYNTDVNAAAGLAGANLQSESQNNAALMGMAGAGIGALGSALSDKRAKKDIKNSSDIDAFLDSLVGDHTHSTGGGKNDPLTGSFTGDASTAPALPTPTAHNYANIKPDPHKGMIHNFFDMVAQKQAVDENNSKVLHNAPRSLDVSFMPNAPNPNAGANTETQAGKNGPGMGGMPMSGGTVMNPNAAPLQQPPMAGGMAGANPNAIQRPVIGNPPPMAGGNPTGMPRPTMAPMVAPPHMMAQAPQSVMARPAIPGMAPRPMMAQNVPQQGIGRGKNSFLDGIETGAGYSLGAGFAGILPDLIKANMGLGGSGKNNPEDDFLNTLVPKDFKYKDEQKQRTGVIAQKVMKSRIGKQIVKETPEGLTLDGTEALNPLLAGLGNVHKRLKELESKKNGR